MGGGYFPFFTENRPQKHKIHAFLHTSQANGGARAPPAPPPGYATAKKVLVFMDAVYCYCFVQLKIVFGPGLRLAGSVEQPISCYGQLS